MRFLLLALCLGLAGCASLTEDECRAGDWREIGREDGIDGRPASFIETHRETCAAYGIAPNVSEWQAGREEGLKAYCTPRNAYREGTKGRSLSPVCSEDNLRALVAANQKGLRYNTVRHEMADVENEIRVVQFELAQLAPDDPARRSLTSRLSFLRLKLLRLRSERLRLRY